MVKYEDFLAEIDQISDKTGLKDYHAFVYWFIETNFGIDEQKILNSICDGTHDKGVDAVIIDDIEKNVTIIQSKFERAGNKVQIKEAEIKLLAAVKNYFNSRKALDAAIKNGNEIAKRLLTNAFDSIRKKAYSLELFFITTHKNIPDLDDLIHDTYEFKREEFTVYDYPQIMQLYSDKLRDFTPRLGPYCLPYQDADKHIIRTSSHNSWVLTISLEQIHSMVNKHGDHLFKKDVRDFLGDNRCNKGIQDTIKNDPDNFWYYNNGISILCDDANIVMESNYIRIVNPQIVNGCQTARSIEKFQGELKGDVMVRLIASKDHEFIDRITFYQNSSNPVKKRDLKSNDPVQVRLKRELKLQGYYYEVKRGKSFKEMVKKYPAMKQQYVKVINNEKVAEVLAAIKLNPGIAVSKGSDAFFDNYYDELFDTKIATFNCFAPIILHWIIQDTYTGDNADKFRNFEKAYAFKNPAAFYVLKFIYESIGNKDNWEKIFVSFYENINNDDETYNSFEDFVNEIDRIISKYFEIIYKAWKASEEPNHNTYLKNSSTIKDIEKRYSKDIKLLKKQTASIFMEYELV